jgi:D-cysteine desulfhydrase
MISNGLLNRVAYVPPKWLSGAVTSIPASRVELGRFPTPIHSWPIGGTFENSQDLEFYIKRDDLSSFDLGGNKVRKLQFLLEDALKEGCDCVVTIGGVQSNHARATAVASRQLGLDPYLILRTRGQTLDPPEILNDSLVGNLMFDRMVGATLKTVTSSVYAQCGAQNLVNQLVDQLRADGRKPYAVPLGGSNALGAFGYLDAINEIQEQGIQFDHLVFACGSGGTAAGLSLGAKLAGIPSVHAVGVCDSPAYFYEHIEETAADLGVDFALHGKPEEWLKIYHGAGLGYSRSKPEELDFILNVAQTTGVTLDPVYSGKGLYYFLHEVVKAHPDTFKKGQRVLFLHTGGALGLYDKHEELAQLMASKEWSGKGEGFGKVSAMDFELPKKE